MRSYRRRERAMPRPPGVGGRIRLAILTTAMALGFISISYGSYCGILIWGGNFHAVAAGQFYRSAELTKREFAKEIEAHHIRSVLNLRGANATAQWYQDEVAAAREQGVAHFDVGISARDPVPPDKIAEILDVLRNAPKPLLVHCQSGADRTGFVAALYRYAVEGAGSGVAERELSLWYGHFPYLTSKTWAMDESIRAYVLAHPRPTSPEIDAK